MQVEPTQSLHLFLPNHNHIAVTHPLALLHAWSLLSRTLETGIEINLGDETNTNKLMPLKALKLCKSKSDLFLSGQ